MKVCAQAVEQFRYLHFISSYIRIITIYFVNKLKVDQSLKIIIVSHKCGIYLILFAKLEKNLNN